MGWRIVVYLVVAAVVGAACSDSPRLAPPPDRPPDVLTLPEPQLFASGTVMAGASQETLIEWDLEEIIGFPHAVTLTAASSTTTSVRSASRQGEGDRLWLVGTTLTPGGPAVVFGGADGTIDSIVLVNAQGDEMRLDLIDVPELDWHLALEQLPSGWSPERTGEVEVIARKEGVEITREPLPGLEAS